MRDLNVINPIEDSTVMKPPKFVPNRTNKIQYTDALYTWADIIRSFAKAHPKAKARLETMGLILYLACDDEAKPKIRAKEAQKLLYLKGDKSDRLRSDLILRLVETISYETPHEKVQMEVNLLNNIHQCKRCVSDQTEAYANRFQRKVAQYVHQRNGSTSDDDQKWVLLLIHNAKSSVDTRNSITF